MSYGHCGSPIIRPSDWLALTPAQKGTLMRRFIRRAHRARTRAMGRVLLGWARYLRHRQRMRDLAALSAMDDMALRDMGVCRCQIRGAIESGADLRSVR
ncbi:MAG: DUF1127 domain-containing protein [Bradyrhizobium sp.]|nr:DUF1127 domain-containing protein [Bradyrhizobium sp.]